MTPTEARSLRRSSRNTNRIPLPSSAAQRSRFDELFVHGDADNDGDIENDNERDDMTIKVSSRWNLKRVHCSPHIYVVENFLSASELRYFDARIQQTRFQPSYVDILGDSGDTSAVREQSQRTSRFVCFPKRHSAVVAKLEQRAAELVGAWDSNVVEPLQLVRYRPGEFFGVHHDLGDIRNEDDDEDDNNNQEQDTTAVQVTLPPKSWFAKRRLVTVFCYLNDVPEGAGGETFFPHCKHGVHPQRGRAVVFSNVQYHEDGRSFVPDPRTIHEGRPVLGNSSANNKYGLNIWIGEE